MGAINYRHTDQERQNLSVQPTSTTVNNRCCCEKIVWQSMGEDGVAHFMPNDMASNRLGTFCRPKTDDAMRLGERGFVELRAALSEFQRSAGFRGGPEA
jgi:hypothetical protein